MRSAAAADMTGAHTVGKPVLLSFFHLVSGSLMLALVSVYSVFTL